MGFLGGDNDEPGRGEELLDQQLIQNQAELEAKKQSLYQTRLDIIKGQGGENWTPDYNKRAPRRPFKPGMGGRNIDPFNIKVKDFLNR